jgi:hypothetical protein
MVKTVKFVGKSWKRLNNSFLSYAIQRENYSPQLEQIIMGFYAFSNLDPTEYIVACQTMGHFVTVVPEQVTKAYFDFG